MPRGAVTQRAAALPPGPPHVPGPAARGAGRGAAALHKALRPPRRAADRGTERRVRQCGCARRDARALRRAARSVPVSGACGVSECRSPSCRRVPSSCAAPGPLGSGLGCAALALAAGRRRAVCASEPGVCRFLQSHVWDPARCLCAQKAKRESLGASHGTCW